MWNQECEGTSEKRPKAAVFFLKQCTSGEEWLKTGKACLFVISEPMSLVMKHHKWSTRDIQESKRKDKKAVKGMWSCEPNATA